MRFATGGIITGAGDGDEIPTSWQPGYVARPAWPFGDREVIVSPTGQLYCQNHWIGTVSYSDHERRRLLASAIIRKVLAEIDARTEQRISRMHTNYHRRRK